MENNIIGKRIAEYRRLLTLTQAELAEKLGVTHQAISQWERGDTCPDVYSLPTIARVLGVSIDALFGDGESVVPEVKPTVEVPAAHPTDLFADDGVLRVRVFIGSRMVQQSELDAATREVRFKYEGDALNVDSQLSVECDSVGGDATSGTSLNVNGCVGGNASSGVSMTVSGSIEGDASSGTSMNVSGDIEGDASSGTSMSVDGDIEGDVTTNDLKVKGDVGGNVNANGNIEVRGNVESDIILVGSGEYTVKVDGEVMGELKNHRQPTAFAPVSPFPDDDKLRIVLFRGASLVAEREAKRMAGDFKVTLDNDVGSVESWVSLACGNVSGSATSGTSMNVGGAVGGNANSGTSMSVGGDVGGSANSGTSMTVGGSVKNNATAGLSVTVKGDIGGRAMAGLSVKR